LLLILHRNRCTCAKNAAIFDFASLKQVELHGNLVAPAAAL
jgi:hypothetical protein